MSIGKKMAAGLLGLAVLAFSGSTAHSQTPGGRMGGMMMGGGMMGGTRGAFMGQSSPMVSPMAGMSGFNPGMGLFQPRMLGSNLGTGLTNFGSAGMNSFGNTLGMQFRGSGMGYGMAGSSMGGYGAAGGNSSMSSYGVANRNYGFSSQQSELPHPAGDVKVAPADAAVIRLRVPDQFATVSFNGQSVSSIGRTRTYVTPNLASGNVRSYEIKATWSTATGQKSAEKVVDARPGQISSANFTRE
jgi:uncharacterized protein (TIGR03000 family)